MRLAALLPLLASFAAAAQEAPERRVLDAEEGAAYAAVGRLNVAGRRFCTATLIEPAVVATAAHCLFHPRTGARVADSELRFVAGFRQGEYAAVREVVRSVTDEAYVFDGVPDFAAVSADLALLALDAPVPAEAAAPIAAGARGDGELAIVSYARDRPQLPTLEAPCPVASDVGGVLALRCGVNFGASGGPVLEGEGADARLVAVVSAMGRVVASGADVTLAVAIEPALVELRAALDAVPGGSLVPPPMPRPPRGDAADNG
ncbi:MAG: trypsin-like serine protease [Amaricoccus sp.]